MALSIDVNYSILHIVGSRGLIKAIQFKNHTRAKNLREVKNT
jgi:hypothetical protein